MITQEVTSFSNPETIYSLTINEDGRAIDCSCPNHYYSKKHNPNHICKHMNFYTQQAREREENQGCYLRMMSNPW